MLWPTQHYCEPIYLTLIHPNPPCSNLPWQAPNASTAPSMRRSCLPIPPLCYPRTTVATVVAATVVTAAAAVVVAAVTAAVVLMMSKVLASNYEITNGKVSVGCSSTGVKNVTQFWPTKWGSAKQSKPQHFYRCYIVIKEYEDLFWLFVRCRCVWCGRERCRYGRIWMQ